MQNFSDPEAMFVWLRKKRARAFFRLFMLSDPALDLFSEVA